MATGRVPTTANSPLTAKGDLFTYDTNQARLPVGNNGETLLADSSTSTGLRWGNNLGFTAGKNKIINGDFNINQRGFTSSTANQAYSFDRWIQFNGGTSGTQTITPEVFTLGSAPVAGYEGKNYLRCVTAAGADTNTRAGLGQRIEGVRTFAGQTITISFWAKAGSGTPKIGLEIEQYFGSGGSPSASVLSSISAVTISTSWARYSVTVNVPSISGKTIGTNNNDFLYPIFWLSAGSDFASRASSIGIQNNTFDIWGVQVEAGSVATAFQTATGTLAGELALAQRYCIVYSGDASVGAMSANATTSVNRMVIATPVTMRTTPSASYTGTIQLFDGVTATNVSSLGTTYLTQNAVGQNFNVASGLTQYRTYQCYLNSGTLTFSSEL